MNAAPAQPAAEQVLDDVRRHDALLAARGLVVWIGAEPTFTDPLSQDRSWLSEAEGGDKEARARALISALAPRLDPAARLCRAQGRQYPEEEKPRFAYGALWRRDGSPASWNGGGLDSPAAEPPADAAHAWLTVTPDPAVVEVNMAPAEDLATFLRWCRTVYAAAGEAGLSPVRYRYNGRASDSGGGGQITLGGPSPELSPFLVHPWILPGLLRYLNRHPSLSYRFASDCVGSASQGPRPDEGVRERFEELSVALDRLEGRRPSPEELWGSLAPLLVDCSGNSHRAELNVEKLWNPHHGGRGMLGLVEFRSLHMPAIPERMVAVGALFRSLVARLLADPFREPLVEWGSALHDRFALPHFIDEDLHAVLADLRERGFGLGPALEALLWPPRPQLAEVALGGATLIVSEALEFWPLVGDLASQERHGARLVDSSTERIQIALRVPAGESPGRLAVCGCEVPLRALPDGKVHLAGVRYRAFVPRPGLHPGLDAHDPLWLAWERGGRALRVALHGWNPSGGVYDGLPRDAAEAARRRKERVVVTESPFPADVRQAAASESLTVDLRRVI